MFNKLRDRIERERQDRRFDLGPPRDRPHLAIITVVLLVAVVIAVLALIP